MNKNENKIHILLKQDRKKKIVILKILELIQYTIIYTVTILYIGKFLNKYFPKLDKGKKKIQLLFEIILQMIVIVVIMYFVRKFIQFIPFIYHDKDYEQGGVSEVYGELTIAFVYVITQYKLGEKILYYIGVDS